LSSECNWYWDQYDALDALVEALRTDNGWLEYRVEVMRDELLEQDAQAAEDTSVVAKVRMVLLERDKALRKAREDMAAVRDAAVEFERELASARDQLQQDRATLEEVGSWQSQAEEESKEAEQLRTSLADKAASLASMEEQLRQEYGAHQQAEARLQQERSALEEARAALKHEGMAREEAQGQLQQEHDALEETRATLKLRDEEISRLDGELNQLSVSHEDLRQAGEEKDAMILDLKKAAETACTTLETEKKQVEGEPPLSAFRLLARFVCDPLPIFVFCFFGFQTGRMLLGIRGHRRRSSRRPTTPRNRSWKSCGPPPSRRAKGSRKARRRPGARRQVASAPSAHTLPSACTAPFTWVSRRLSAWWLPTTRSTLRLSQQDMSSPSASTTK
jgi:hypothetical protein